MLIALVVLPFFVNYLVRTYAWIAHARRRGARERSLLGCATIRFLNTPWAVIGGLVYGYLAFMILPIYASLDRMDPALIEAGKDLYGTALADVPARDLAAHDAGRAGRLRARLPARRWATSWPRRCSAGPTTCMVGNLIQQQFLGAENWPFGAALTDGDDGLPADLDGRSTCAPRRATSARGGDQA